MDIEEWVSQAHEGAQDEEVEDDGDDPVDHEHLVVACERWRHSGFRVQGSEFRFRILCFR